MFECIDCPKCGYDRARLYISYSMGEADTDCERCGYYLIQKRTYEAKNPSEMSVWDCEEKGGGGGNFALKKHGDDCVSLVPVTEALMAQVKNSLNEYEYCQYTFEEDGYWYLHDLLKDTEEPFWEWDFDCDDDE